MGRGYTNVYDGLVFKNTSLWTEEEEGGGRGSWFCFCRGTFTMRSNKPCKFFLRSRGFIPGGEREDANVHDALVKNSSNEKRLLFLRVGVEERLQSFQQLVHNPSAGEGGGWKFVSGNV